MVVVKNPCASQARARGGHKIHDNINYIYIALSYYDNLVADLEDRNSELIAEVNSLRIILTTEQNSPPPRCCPTGESS